MAYARLDTRESFGLHPSLRGMGLGSIWRPGKRSLGDFVAPPAWSTTASGGSSVTVDDALNQAEQGLSSPDFPDPTWWQQAMDDIQNMQISFSSPACSGMQQASSLQLVKVAGGMAIQDTNIAANTAAAAGSAIGASVAAAIPIIGAVFSTITGIFGIFSAHHAAAVKEEQSLECALVPAANDYFQAIQSALSNGTITYAQASAALKSLPSEFIAQAQPSFQNNPCNAMCEYSVVVSAICNYWSAQYDAAAAQQAAVANEEATALAENAGTPTPATPVAASATSLTSPAVPVSQATGTTSTGASTAYVTAAPPVTETPTSIPTWAWLLGGFALLWAVS